MDREPKDTKGVTEAAGEREEIFAGIRRITLVILAALLIVCAIFIWRTRDAMEHLPSIAGSRQGGASAAATSIVDLHTWQTAQALTPLAVSAEEMEFAREAERLADHETDQAFASALRLAVPQHRTMSPKALALSKRIADLQAAIVEDQRLVKAATTGAKAGDAPGAPVSDEASVDAAQLGLDTDELKDAQGDFAREIGDQRTRIQQELTAHETEIQKYDAQSKEQGQIATISSKRFGTLAGRLGAWQAQRSRLTLLGKAAAQTRQSVASLTAQHDAMETQADHAAAAANVATPSAPATTPAPAVPPPSDSNPSTGTVPATPAATSRLSELKQRSAQRQLLGIFDDRISTVQQLATVYERWSDQVRLQHRIVGHLLLESIIDVLVILMVMLIGGVLARRWMDRSSLDRRRMQTLRTVVGLAVQLLGVILILLVVFGAPSQTPTILGLTTAGLTVVLQDFILAFFGWFVLMGRNGISVGDAVEIDGVSGDVIDIGLFRTTMLETGNWTAQGHPTGRRVAIINKFAINGQYFNFSTAGQFLWDEMTVPMGAQEDPYGRVKAIEDAVHAETDDEAALARQEWRRSDRLHAAAQGNTAAEVNLRPSAGGFDVLLRYVTRASQRVETRNRLYGRVLEILHAPAAPAPAETPAVAAGS